jgi:hypothetical protein
MFRVEPPPIIRSSVCTYSFWYLSNLAAICCDHSWNGTGMEPDGDYNRQQQGLTNTRTVRTVRAPVMGGGSTRNMYSVTEINKLRKVTSCWLYLRNICRHAEILNTKLNELFGHYIRHRIIQWTDSLLALNNSRNPTNFIFILTLTPHI